MPKISVIMPVYNGEKYLPAAIESILNQTFHDFEFIIINDGSTDQSRKIIQSYNDKRIQILDQKNQGVIISLNRGISLSRGQYIARMDCDDISLPERLEKQVAFMDRNPDVAVCGAWVKTMGKLNTKAWIKTIVTLNRICKYPVEPEEVSCRLLFEPALAHPSVLIRKDILCYEDLRYDMNYRYAEDYELWVKISKRHRIANIGEVLLRYRYHYKNVGTIYTDQQRETADKIRRTLLIELGIDVSEEDMAIHSAISRFIFNVSEDFLLKAYNWLLKIEQANNKRRIYDKNALQKELVYRWYVICFFSLSYGSKAWKIIWDSPLINYNNIRWFFSHLFGFGLERKINHDDGKNR